VVTAWLVAVVILLARVMGDPGVEVSGDTQALLPPEHRAVEGEPLLLLTIRPEAQEEAEGGVDLLLAAASAVGEQLGERRVPLGPPAAELTGWLDAHALYLLPVEAHEALAERLSRASMSAAVDALRARLSSPIYGLSGEEPRRDPLRLQQLSRQYAGRLTHLGNGEDMPAELTPTGDLLALDGQALLIELRSDEPPAALLEEVRAVLPSDAVEAALIGPGPRREQVAADISARWPRLTTLVVAGLVVVLSLALRAVRPVVAILLAVGSVVLGVVVLSPPPGPHDVAMLVLLAGFGCEGALHLTRISPRGWPAAAALGGALLPLWVSPYPAWRAWSLGWLVGIVAVVVLLRGLVPGLLSLARYTTAPARTGVRLQPLRPLAVVLAVSALAAGAWSLPQLPFLALDRTPRTGADEGPQQLVRDAFFDPRLVVRATSEGDTPAAALERAAEHARQLAALVPDDATRVDSPGRLVLPAAELRSRQRSLQALEIDDRMTALHELLATRGFRPDAFGEFLRGATDLEDLPTPKAALEGPLGPWIEGYLEDEGPALATRVHLRPRIDDPVPRLVNDEGDVIELRGPAVAARRDRLGFADGLGLYVMGQLWIGALAVWLGTRSLATALACACAALVAQTALLAAMLPLGLPLGAAMLPVVLLVGAAAVVAGGRACQSVRNDERLHATGVLLSGLGQAAAGLALFASRDPLWEQLGLMVAVGAVIASGAGLFVAPGLMRLFGGGGRGAARAPVRPEPEPEPEPDTAHLSTEPLSPEAPTATSEDDAP